MFPCSGCGLCCKNIHGIEELKAYDLGNGVCMYLNMQSNACEIYDTRPDICQVDKMFVMKYSEHFSKKEFYALNANICNQLQEFYNFDKAYRINLGEEEMPIPFIIAGVALAAAGYGVKKGYDAKCDYDDAEDYNRWAEEAYDEAQDKLNDSRKRTNEQIEALGHLKVSIYRKSLADFVDIFSKIKNVDFEDRLDLDLSIGDINGKSMFEIRQEVLKITELAGGATVALSSGALAGIGAFGGAGMFATASTGTAISSLSGAAATNATLAWFGGGSLAAGGLGMAGGMAVLGGIVAGPVLAVAGGMMAAKAEAAKYEAKSNYMKAKAAAEEMNTAYVATEAIYQRTTEFIEVLRPLKNKFSAHLDKLEGIVEKNIDYLSYNDDDKKIVMIAVSIAQTLKNVCDAPVMDENGEIVRKSREVLQKAKEITARLEEI